MPAVATRIFDVASSPVEPQTAMSPAPIRTSEPGGGGGGGDPGTVIDDDPDLPPADAVMVAVPALTAVTVAVAGPVGETVATAVFEEVHVNDVTEPAGLAVAVS